MPSNDSAGTTSVSAMGPVQVQPYGKYFLVRKLAEGGMAEIFLAKQVGAEGFERNVVIKRMLRHLSSLPDFVGMFLDEARLAARLNHQNIVQINDLGMAEGCHYICMEYLAGEDFSTVVRSASRRREYVPLAVAIRVIAEAAHGLHYAHAFTDEAGGPLNIVHRDVSPSNIYVTYQGQVKVLDFGIAKAESRITHTTAGVVKGKYVYMAPEQARSEPVDRRADIFSLGVSLYEALTNTRPFARDTDLAVLNAVLKCEYTPLPQIRPDLPPELSRIVQKAMAPTVQERYQSAGELATDLERLLASNNVVTGAAVVSRYLTASFGEEQVTQKSRVPTLSSLKAAVPAGAPTTATGTAAGVGLEPLSGANDKTPAVAHREVTNTWRSGSIRVRRTTIAGFAAAAVGVFLVAAIAYFLGGERPARPGPAVVVPLTSVGPPSPPDAGATIPVQVAADPAQAPKVTIASGTKPAEKKRPIQLTANEIQKVVTQGRTPIMKCFEQFKTELPDKQGQVSVQFTILGSGKVSDAELSGGLAGTQVGRCLEERVRKLRFPLHKDREVTLSLPFAYRVER